MEFDLSQEQRLFRDMTREFVKRSILPVAKDIDRHELFPEEILKQMAPLGLLGAPIDAKYGGLGVDHVCYAVICEETAKASFLVFNAALRVHTSLLQETVLARGNEAQQQKYLPRLTKGEMLGCFVMGDLANHQIAGVEKGAGWILDGTRTMVPNGSVADIALVLAALDKGGHHAVGAFLVERGTPGFSSRDSHSHTGPHHSNAGDLVFQACAVPKENLIGGVAEGSKIATVALNNGRYSTAAGCVGIAQACIEASVKYAQERNQFGQPLANFELVQNMIGDMIVNTDAARYLVYRAGYLKGKELPNIRETAMAKCMASEAALQATSNAIEIHGACGLSAEFPIERYYRDARSGTLYEDISEIMKLMVGRAALDIGALE